MPVAGGDAFVIQEGAGSGGSRFLQWWAAAKGLEPQSRPHTTPDGIVLELAGFRLVDAASAPTCNSDWRGKVVLIRDGHRSETADVGPVTEGDVLGFLRSLGHDSEFCAFLSRTFSTATAIYELAATSPVMDPEQLPEALRRLDRAIIASPQFRDLLSDIQRRGGSTALDLCRAVYLIAPGPAHVGDEWSDLASQLAGRPISIAQIDGLLMELPELFRLKPGPEGLLVQPVNRYALLLMGGLVPGSSSEYHRTFLWMLERSRATLVRGDDGDDFVRLNLPHVALRAGAMVELLSDGAGLLACDIDELVDCIESEPGFMTLPSAKAVMLSSHRLRQDSPNRSSQMELALRRVSLHDAADSISTCVRPRPWRPVWASASPVNVHRVISEAPSSAMCVALAEDGSPFRGYAGFADGRIRLIGTRFSDTVLARDGCSPAEVRDIATVRVNDADYVAAVTSDSVVEILRVDGSGVTLAWTDREAHTDPLSAVAIHRGHPSGPTVISSGVKGEVVEHRLADGSGIRRLIKMGAEVRGIRPVTVAGDAYCLLVAVDGRLAVLSLTSAEVVASVMIPDVVPTRGAAFPTPTCLDAQLIGGTIEVMVGTATGRLVQGQFDPVAGSLRIREVALPKIPPADINAVSIGESQTCVTRNDGVWLLLPKQAGKIRVFAGHVGPIMDCQVQTSPETGEVAVVTVGAEGAIRLWRHVENVSESMRFERVNRHRGPVTAISARERHGGPDVVTGGADGDVRHWRLDRADANRILSRHDGRVTCFLMVKVGDGDRLVAGASDGSIRHTRFDGEAERAALLGIAHEGVTALAHHSRQGFFWSGGNDGAVTAWDLISGIARDTVEALRHGAVLALCAYGDSLIIGGQDGSMSLLDPLGNLRVMRQEDCAITSLTEVPGSAGLIAGLATGEVVFVTSLNSEKRDRDRLLTTHAAGVTGVRAFMLAGRLVLASIGRDRFLRLIDIEATEELERISLDGFPTYIDVCGRHICVATSVGAALFEFSEDESLVRDSVPLPVWMRQSR